MEQSINKLHLREPPSPESWGKAMVRIPSSTYQIYNIKLPNKLKFSGLTAVKNIKNKVLFFCSFLGRKEPKELQKRQR